MARRKPGFVGDDAASYLASVSDLMAGLMFVFIITVSVFAFSFKQVTRQLEERSQELVNTQQIRAQLLREIQQSLEREGVHVEVDLKNGILRLPEQILFPLGQARLTSQGALAVEALSRALGVILPCYSGGDRAPAQCESWNPERLEAVFIEGHTDDLPLRSKHLYASNWELSTARAIETYRSLIATAEGAGLETLTNGRDQAILSVSGYAYNRPLVPNVDEDSRARNRRIDIRFIMTPPDVLDEGS